MSDRDLRNLYENICRGGDYIKPASITDLYTKTINEQYTLNITDDSGNVVYQTRIDDDQKVQKIKKDLICSFRTFHCSTPGFTL